MATENGWAMVTYLVVRPPPQASKKLSPSHRSPALPRPRPHCHCPLVWAASTAGADSTARMGGAPAPCG